MVKSEKVPDLFRKIKSSGLGILYFEVSFDIEVFILRSNVRTRDLNLKIIGKFIKPLGIR